MKCKIAYFLVALYTFGIGQPVLPLVKDAFAHLFFRVTHMATVHHQHGTHHAHHEVAKASQEKENKKNSSIKSAESVSLHIQVQSKTAQPDLVCKALSKYFPFNVEISSQFSGKHYPPPKPV